MRRRRLDLSRPLQAMIGVGILVVALGGTAAAAGLINGRQIVDHSIAGTKLAKGTIQLQNLSPSVRAARDSSTLRLTAASLALRVSETSNSTALASSNVRVSASPAPAGRCSPSTRSAISIQMTAPAANFFCSRCLGIAHGDPQLRAVAPLNTALQWRAALNRKRGGQSPPRMTQGGPGQGESVHERRTTEPSDPGHCAARGRILAERGR